MSHMTQKANPVTLTLQALPQSGNPQPSEPSEPYKPYEPSRRRRVQGRSILRTLFLNPSTQPAAPAAPLFYKTCGEAATTPFEPSYNMFGRGRLEDLSLLDLSPLQHEHAFGIMVIGAIEDIPLNPV